MKFLAILSSMSFESDMIRASLKEVRAKDIARKKIYKGKLSGCNILLMNTGIGKVNAAHSATCVIEHFPVKGIVNFGVGGAYSGSGLNVGDIAMASKEIYGDEGVAGLKCWKGLDELGIPVVQIGRKKYFNEFSSDTSLLIKSGQHVTRHPSPIIKSGPFVTVSSTSGTTIRARELEKHFHAICENMEGAAIAHVCKIYQIPFIEIRGISNIAGVRDKRKWNLKLAAENCQKAVISLLTYLKIPNIL